MARAKKPTVRKTATQTTVIYKKQGGKCKTKKRVAPKKKAAPKRAAPKKKAAPKRAAPKKKAAPKSPSPKRNSKGYTEAERKKIIREATYMGGLPRNKWNNLSARERVARHLDYDVISDFKGEMYSGKKPATSTQLYHIPLEIWKSEWNKRSWKRAPTRLGFDAYVQT